MGETRNGNIAPGKAKLCKILTLQRPEKEVLHFTYVTPQKEEKKKQHSIPCSPLPLPVIPIDAGETESRLRPLGQIPLHFSVNSVSRPKSLGRKWSCPEDVDDWLYKHSVYHPGRQTSLRHRAGCRHLTCVRLGGCVNVVWGYFRSRHKPCVRAPVLLKWTKTFLKAVFCV